MQLRRIIFVGICTTACQQSPVDWGAIAYSNVPSEPRELSPPSRSTPDVPHCPGSMRIANAGTGLYALWWQANIDSSAVLMTARNIAGKWEAPVIADSTDRGVRGCGRPAPAIALDSVSGYIHYAYFAEPESGAGIFFEHSMDSAKTFHSPVAIVYGRNPSRVSIAADRDRVAVAYEDPNSTLPNVSLALSRTQGHIFEHRLQASGNNGNARQPVVRIEGDSVKLWWSEYSSDRAVSATRTVYRSGKLK